MERWKQLVETLYTEPKEEKILGTFLQLENTGEQDLASVTPKQKKKRNCPPESDKNQNDIQIQNQKIFCSDTLSSNKRNLKSKNRRAQMS